MCCNPGYPRIETSWTSDGWRATYGQKNQQHVFITNDVIEHNGLQFGNMPSLGT